MNCSKIKYYLSLYINGMLPSEKKNIINQHLLLCDTCKKYAEALQRQKISIQIAVKNEEMSESLPEAISMAIASADQEKSRFQLFRNLSWRSLSRNFKIAASIAAILLIAIATTYIMISHRSPAGELVTISGKIVCFGCELKKNYGMPYDCKTQGHVPAIKTPEGDYYSFNLDNIHYGKMQKEDMYGCKINAVGYVFGKEHFVHIIAVNSIQR